MLKKKMNFKVLAVALLLVFGFSSFKPAKKEIYIGLQLWSVKNDMKKDVAGTLAAVSEMGYGFVESASYGDGKIYGMDPVEFKNLCEAKGLDYLGAHCGQAVPSDEKWDETMKWWDTCIAAHKAAGVQWIVQPFMDKVGYESKEGILRYCKYFNEVGEKCNAAGIRFGYHNHDKEFTTEFEGKPVYNWMLENTDPKKVMFQLDLYWIDHGGKVATDYFAEYPKRFDLWHIKDEKELGESGKMDFAASFAKRKKSGAKYGIVEVERYNFEPLESCKKSFEYLKTQDYIDFYKK